MDLKTYKFKDYKLEYFLMYMLVAFSVHGYFYKFPQYVVIGTFLLIIIVIKKKCKIKQEAVIWIGLIIFLEIIQSLINFNFKLQSLLNILFRLLFAYLTVALLKEKFIPIFLRFMFFFSVISLIIFPVLYFNQSLNLFIIYSILPKIPNLFTFEHTFYSYSAQPFIYSFLDYYRYDDLFRNSSLFWEPGVFAAFLCLSIVFNLYFNRKILEKHNIIFFISLITTFSTMGYITFMFIILQFITIKKSFFSKIFFLPLLLLIFSILFEDLPFLKNKLLKDYDNIGNIETTAGRFGSFYLDFKDFMSSPIVGTGRDEYSRFKFSATYDYTSKHRNNGLSSLLATYGIIGFSLYFFLIYLGEKKMNKYFNLNLNGLFTITIALVGFGSPILQLPFFWALTFLFTIQTFNFKPYDNKL